MEKRLELKYRLRISDFDRYLKVMPSAVLDLFSDVATIHANQLGMGLEDMRRKGLMWAVVRTKYEIVKQPEVHQEVIIATWPHTLGRMTFLRDYAIKSLEGETLVKGTSEWVVMDFVERKFANARDAYDGDDAFCEERMFEGKLRKIRDFEPVDEGQVIVPAWTDVDINMHVNNAKYTNFALGVLKPEAGEEIRSLQIDFRKEVLPDVPFTVHALRDEAGLHAKGVSDDDAILFACIAELA